MEDDMGRISPLLTVDYWQTDGPGWPPRSDEVELLWLPLIGPTALATLRRLDALLADGPTLVRLDDLGESLGLRSHATGLRSVVRAVERLIAFDLAQVRSDARLLVRTPIPLLSARQRRALPPGLRELPPDCPSVRALALAHRRDARLRQLAATLHSLGATRAEIETRLARQGFPPGAVERALTYSPGSHLTSTATAAASRLQSP